MKDTIIKLFNLEPQDIEQINIYSESFTVFVFITLKKRFQHCPSCGCSTKRVHDYRQRTIEHGIINDAYTTNKIVWYTDFRDLKRRQVT